MTDSYNYVYVEMWNAKPSWLGLSAEERAAFMKGIDQLLDGLMKPGECEVTIAALNDGDTAPRINYRYMAIWQMDDKSHVKRIADGTVSHNWYEYFDQVNFGGAMMGPDGLIKEIMGL